MKTLDQAKKEYWENFITSSIPKDLQKIYHEDVNKMQCAFEAGVRFMISFTSKSKNDWGQRLKN